MFPTKVIDRGIAYLFSKQQEDGSFLSQSSKRLENFTKARIFHSTFSTSLILSCLNNLKDSPKLKEIKKKAVFFLLKQKSEYWSFNYWARNSKEAKTMPYPDDLDDTFCALSAIYEHNQELLDGTAMAKIVQLLTFCEQKEGGPYKTWVVKESKDKIWQDVDLVVNTNIAYFLHLLDIDMPKLNEFIKSSIDKENFKSSYYPSMYIVIYFISRFFKRDYIIHFEKLIFSKKKKDGSFNNPLYTALAILTLFNLGTKFNKLQASITYLIKTQQGDGSWKPYAFYIDPTVKGQTYYAGSPALTTAFCLNALQKYVEEINKFPNEKSQKANDFYNQVVEKVKQRLSLMDKNIKDQALYYLDATLKADKDRQIALLPYYFKLALGENGRSIKNNFMILLGIANLFGWIAYTIYDNFLDEEGDPKSLPIANITLRELTLIFNNILPKKSGFPTFFRSVMDEIDSVNLWEVTQCRIKVINNKINLKHLIIPDYGNYEKLAKRSGGIALGAIAILFSLGFTIESSEIQSMLIFFKHYIIARQLNDDAHDWEKDLKMGHINSVGSLLLNKIYKRKTNSEVDSDISIFIPKLQKIFWYEIIDNVCKNIFEHIQLARKALEKCEIVVDYKLLDKLLVKYEQAAKLALSERENAIKFLQSYQNQSLIKSP